MIGEIPTRRKARLYKSPFRVFFVCENVLYHTCMKTAGDKASDLIIAPSLDVRPAPLFAPTRKAAQRLLEFFTAQINNAHTRRAYINATRRFADWCASKDIHESLSRANGITVRRAVEIIR
jgi:hypothetical protein